MICPSCNAEIADDSKFCENCGMSFQNASEPEAAPAAAAPKNDQWKTILIVALVAAVASICGTLPKEFYSWVTNISVVLLAFFCWKKYGFATKEMAIAFSVNAFRFIWLDFEKIFGLRSTTYSKFAILARVTLYASLVFYWLIVVKKARSNKTFSLGFFFTNCFTSLYILWKFFKSLSTNFSSVLFYIGWIAFMAVYFLLFLADDELSAPVKALFGAAKEKIASASASSAAKADAPAAPAEPEGDYDICPVCGNKMEKTSIFCTNCGNKKNQD